MPTNDERNCNNVQYTIKLLKDVQVDSLVLNININIFNKLEFNQYKLINFFFINVILYENLFLALIKSYILLYYFHKHGWYLLLYDFLMRCKINVITLFHNELAQSIAFNHRQWYL
jgi:hypothetical protein